MTEVLIYLAVFLPMALAFPAAYFGKKMRKLPGGYLILTVAVTAVELGCAVALLFLPSCEASLSFFGIEGLSLTASGFSGIYGVVAAFMWLMASLYSPMYFEHEKASGKYLFFWLMTLGATVGLFFSADLLSAFFFFEVLSLSSYTWVIEEKNEHAFRAGKTYLIVAVLFGMVFFMGLILLRSAVGTLRIDELYEAAVACQDRGKLLAAGLCLLLGFGAKAGLFPLHIWLPMAHPVAPSPASALLSGVLTKAGVFGMIVLAARVFSGQVFFAKTVLILGTVTMLLGAILGVFATNLKRTLACSSVSQIGFISVGLAVGELLSGMGEEAAEGAALAFAGGFLHMLNHSLLKLLLFLCAGVVAAKAGGLEFDKIKGCGRKHPLFLLLFLTGCLSIGCLPGFGGYVSKTMMHEGLVELAHLTGNFGYTVLEWLFLLSGGMTICYMAKLFTVLFVDKPKNGETVRMKLGAPATLALVLSTLAVLFMSIFPLLRQVAERGMPFFMLSKEQMEELFHILTPGYLFSWVCLKGSGISIAIGVTLFFLVVIRGMRKKEGYKQLWPEAADLQELVYKPLFGAIHALLRLLSRLFELLDRVICPAVLFLLRCGCVLFHLSDGLVKFSVKSYFNPSKKRKKLLARLEEKLARRAEKKQPTKDGREWVRSAWYTVKNTTVMVLRSYAFAMTMTFMGLCLLFIYMILF